MDSIPVDSGSSLWDSSSIEQALQALGEILAVRRHEYAIVVIGGSALNLLGFVQRPTRDVDVLAFGTPRHSVPPVPIVEPPTPLPAAMLEGVRLVAAELGLTDDWLNTGPALQWKQGLPPGLEGRIHWRRYGALTVGLVDRYDLIFFKLYAAADAAGSHSIHYQDLLRLAPTPTELRAAEQWVREQDPSPGFAALLTQVIVYVSADLATTR